MTFPNKKRNRGFVILFAVTISSILMAIAIGVANIALKEAQFETSAKYTNEAFFAADTGLEKVLYKDNRAVSSYTPAPGSWTEIVSSLGPYGLG